MERKPFQDRHNALMSEAESWNTAWKDIQKYIAPTRGHFDDAQPNQGKTIDHKTILNGHASRALVKLSSGMTSGLTSPSRPWFKLGLEDDDLQDFDPVKEWLATVEERMMGVFAKSNIYGALNGVYSEVGSFGTAAMAILPDYEDVMRARLYTCGEYALGTGPDCRVNAFTRKQWMTVGQVVEQYGIENVSESTKNKYDQKSIDSWVQVVQLIQPNPNKSGSPLSQRKPWISVHWEVGATQDKFLRVGGFNRFPILAPRWNTTTTADVYGRSPAWDALGDVRMLQKMEKDSLIALDKVADPPVQADSNVAEVNLLPGGVNRYSATSPNAGVKAVYQLNPDFNAIEMKMQNTKQAISEAFFADLFMMISQAGRPNMTAREVVERHEEKLLMLGPVLERLESELLDPLIDLTFERMMEAGIIPPPPEELSGMELNVEYVSMLAQAQKMVGTTAIEQLTAFTGNLAAAKPAILDKYDEDEAIDAYAKMLGTPPKIIRSAEAVSAVRQQRQEAEQQAQLAASMPGMVEGAKTLSETKVGQNSALDALLAGASGTPAVGN